MEMIECDKKSGIELLKMLDIKPICKYCGAGVTDGNFGGVFSKPTRVSCDNLFCLMMARTNYDEFNFDR